ncbi:hypothetical protein HELRODRAFT_124318, partial [Helobdella robusta]|uniref:Uncharacterized protein n=1 Tax=Helobdella robusta TaxID=6412 RepID=T1EH10_HELRO
IKFLFFAFNVVFWLLGCAILGIGIWLQVSKGSYVTLSTSFNFFSVTFLLICVGTLILLIGFFGCCGSLMENKCLLLVYFILVALTFMLEIVAAVLIFVYRWEINNYLASDLKLGLVSNYKSSDKGEDGLKAGWAYIQSNFNCCGVYNYTDWYEVFDDKPRVPRECCVHNETC